MRHVGNRELRRVAVVDDDPRAREVYSFTVEDADLVPVPQDGPLPALDATVLALVAEIDAVLCDEHLRTRSYAGFNGAELAFQLYLRGVPTVLCTSWERADLEGIRPYRKNIPALLTPRELADGGLPRAIDIVVGELDGDFAPHRRPWRTQVHVVEIDDEFKTVVVEVPAWGDEKIRLRQSILPEPIMKSATEGLRLHASVNIGAESQDELYFDDWELRGR